MLKKPSKACAPSAEDSCTPFDPLTFYVRLCYDNKSAKRSDSAAPIAKMGIGNQVQIQDFVKETPASEAKSCQCSKAELCKQSEPLSAVVQGLLKDPVSFGVFNAQICILPHSRDSFFLIFDT